MEIQKEFLQQYGNHDAKYSASAHHRFDGRPLPVKCKMCSIGKRSIERPVFSVNRPNSYVVDHAYHCSACQKRTRYIPEDNDIPSVYPTNLHCEGPKVVAGAKVKVMLRQQQERTPRQTEPVESFCSKCREETQVKNGGNVYVDHDPQWTLGFNRPLYLERRPTCFNCKDDKVTSNRFIPRDPTILSILPRLLLNISESYGTYDKYVIAVLMDY
jgi:hypothetical protein